MQKFFGFDSTIGVGRNFGFKASEGQLPLEKPVITSVDKDTDMPGMRIEFAQFGHFDSFSIYRSETPMDINNLPQPIVTNLPTMYYIDGDAIEGVHYYYRVGVHRGWSEVISEEYFSGTGLSIPTDYILAYSFDGDVNDASINGLAGVRSGNTSFIEGRKEGTQAMQFNAGCVRTPASLPISGSKLSLSFWFKANPSSSNWIFELTSNSNNASSGFRVYTSSGLLSFRSNKTTYMGNIPFEYNNTWQHVVITVDKSVSASEGFNSYIGNGLENGVSKSGSGDIFGSSTFYIGQRAAASLPLVGAIQDLRVYNRVLNDDERLQLFNE